MLSILPLTFLPFFPSPNLGNHLMAQEQFSLEDRYADKGVNEVFKDNILLNLAYLNGTVKSKENIKWDEVTKPFEGQFTLDPNKTFAFHEDVLPEYQGQLEKTTNAHFNAQEGFKTDGYLFGDGVCHLASLLNWVAQEAGLDVKAPTPHDFAVIPDVPKQFGVAIYNNPGSKQANAQQNLYITNNQGKPVTFKFEYADNKVKVAVLEQN